jgi:hypothetical protein
MKKYLTNHEAWVMDILRKNSKSTDWNEILNFNRIQIGYLQHERIIHLLVTLGFALIFIIAMMTSLIIQSMTVSVFAAMILLLLVPYIFHYFNLENGVQRLYILDKILEKRAKKLVF